MCHSYSLPDLPVLVLTISYYIHLSIPGCWTGLHHPWTQDKNHEAKDSLTGLPHPLCASGLAKPRGNDDRSLWRHEHTYLECFRIR